MPLKVKISLNEDKAFWCYPRYGAHCPDQLSEACCGEDVAVADGGHGDDDPVEGRGDRGEPRTLLDLNEVAEARYKDDPDTFHRKKLDEYQKVFLNLAKMNPLMLTRKIRRPSSL